MYLPWIYSLLPWMYIITESVLEIFYSSNYQNRKIRDLWINSSVTKTEEFSIYTGYPKNDWWILKFNLNKAEGARNIRFVAFCLGDQGIYAHKFSKLVKNFVNRWRCCLKNTIKQSFQNNYRFQQQRSAVWEQNL